MSTPTATAMPLATPGRWVRRLAGASIAFFAIKGLAWLVLGAALWHHTT